MTNHEAQEKLARKPHTEQVIDLIAQLRHYPCAMRVRDSTGVLRGGKANRLRHREKLYVEEAHDRLGEHLRIVGPDVFVYSS